MAERAREKPKPVVVEIDTYAASAGTTEPLCTEMETRINAGWKLLYMLNLDKVAYSVIYVVWSREI